MNILRWVTYLTIPRLPPSVTQLVYRLFSLIPYREHYRKFLIVGFVLLLPTVASASVLNPIVDWGKQTVTTWIHELTVSLAGEAMKGLYDFLLQPTNVTEYSNVREFIRLAQTIAASLLAVAIVWEALQNVVFRSIDTNEKSLSELVKGGMISGFLIMFLPYAVTNILIPINNLFVEVILEVGIGIDIFDRFLKIPPIDELLDSSGFLIVMLIFVIAALLLSIIAAIRYVEIIVILILSPFVAISIARNGDALGIWVRETVAIVFTQTIHMILLNLLITFAASPSFWGYLKALGVIIVMLRGPQLLRQFLYSTGAGSVALSVAGSASRFVAMRMMIKP